MLCILTVNIRMPDIKRILVVISYQLTTYQSMNYSICVPFTNTQIHMTMTFYWQGRVNRTSKIEMVQKTIWRLLTYRSSLYVENQQRKCRWNFALRRPFRTFLPQREDVFSFFYRMFQNWVAEPVKNDKMWVAWWYAW